MNPLATLAISFTALSLVAVGGVTPVLPEIHRIVVVRHHWLTAAQLTDLYAISHAAPGPNMLLVALVGGCSPQRASAKRSVETVSPA